MDSTSSDNRIAAALNRVKGEGAPNLLHEEALEEGEFRNSQKVIVKYENEYDRDPRDGLVELSTSMTKDLSVQEIKHWFIHKHHGGDEMPTKLVHPRAKEELSAQNPEMATFFVLPFMNTITTSKVWAWYVDNYRDLFEYMEDDLFYNEDDDYECDGHHWHIYTEEINISFEVENGSKDGLEGFHFNNNPLVYCCNCDLEDYYYEQFGRSLELTMERNA